MLAHCMSNAEAVLQGNHISFAKRLVESVYASGKFELFELVVFFPYQSQ